MKYDNIRGFETAYVIDNGDKYQVEFVSISTIDWVTDSDPDNYLPLNSLAANLIRESLLNGKEVYIDKDWKKLGKEVLTSVVSINPITDLCILKTDLGFNGNLPPLESLDNIPVGEKIGMFGFPHCVMGRRVLTYQETEIGAKMLLETSGIKSKYATINIQTRPGQSGSLVFNIRTGAIIGLLIGTYAPASGVIIAGINPHELNQTSYCISANHIKEML